MDLASLSDEILLGKVEALSETERFSLIDFLIHLGELDDRRACQKYGYASAFAYLTRRLGYSECDAMRRIRTARAARAFPSILTMLARGELHLVSVSLLQPLLTPENHQRLLRKACRRSTREVERLVTEMAPARREPHDRIRPLPPASSALPPEIAASESAVGQETGDALQLPGPHQDPAPLLGLAPPSASSAQVPAVPIEALREKRVMFTFAAGERVQDWLEQARDLLRHRFPDGRMEDIIGEALRRLVEDELPGQRGPRRTTALAPPDGRRVPKWVQDEVWRRDSGRCAFTGPEGLRCGETAWLEFDHIVPWALGGPSDDPANIRLLCRSHNQAEARRIFGGPREGPDGPEAPKKI